MLINREMFGILSPDYFLSAFLKKLVILIKLRLHDMQKNPTAIYLQILLMKYESQFLVTLKW